MADPVGIAGCALWLDANDPATIVPNFLGSLFVWIDKSGNGRDASIGTATAPTSGTRTQNTRNVIDFDGTNDYLQTPNLTLAQPFTVFVVTKNDDGADGADQRVIAPSSSAFGFGKGTANTWRVNWGTVQTAGTADTVARYFASVANGTSSLLRTNGTQIFAGSGGTTGSFTAEGIRICRTNAAGTQYWDGWVAEVLVYNTALSAPNIALVEDYLNVKWFVPFLVVADSSHAHTTENVALTQAHTLVVADSAHGHTTDAVALTQAHTLAVADSSHAHTADAVTLTQAHVLAVSDSAHGNTTENVTLTQALALVVADSAHGSTTDAVALTQAHTLAGVADSSHAHTTEAVVVDVSSFLAVADSAHGHTTEAVVLTQAHTLAVNDSAHAHTADAVSLTQAHTLSAADSSHGHTTEAVALAQVHHLIPADSAHGHTTDAVVISQASFLAVADSFHAHTTDAVALSQAQLLAVADTEHGHTSELVRLRLYPYGIALTVSDSAATIVVTGAEAGIVVTETHAAEAVNA